MPSTQTALPRSFIGLFTDPGAVHTGFVIVEVRGKEFWLRAASEVNGIIESGKLVLDAPKEFGVNLWLHEGFRLYPDKKDSKEFSEFEEIQTIGAMKLAANLAKIPWQFKQFAHQIKIPPMMDDTLRSFGFPLHMMPSVHTKDALRHFLVFWCFSLKYGYPQMKGLRGASTNQILK